MAARLCPGPLGAIPGRQAIHRPAPSHINTLTSPSTKTTRTLSNMPHHHLRRRLPEHLRYACLDILDCILLVLLRGQLPRSLS